MKKFVGMCMTVILSIGLLFGSCITEAEEPSVTIVEEAEAVLEVKTEQIQEKETPKPYTPVITMHKEEESADYIWEELSKYSPNDLITAGVMGYFWRESNLRSNAVAGWHIRNIGSESDICEVFTEEVDAGLIDGSSKEYFLETVAKYGGYGLGQWLSAGYLEHFYDFVREREGSIGDAAIQCEFIFESMRMNEELWQMLLECETAAQTGRRIAIWYDGASWEGVNYISTLSHQFYKEYCQ